MSALDRALAAARLGWHVLPCGADKRPLTKHGLKDATTDAGQISKWWAKHPAALPAVVAGPSGLAIADFDVKGGKDGLAALSRLGHPLPATWRQDTPSGGSHAFYVAPAGIDVPNGSADLFERGSGIDRRTGESYAILYEAPPASVAELAEAPAWLIVSAERAASADRGTSAGVDDYLARLVPGKPSKKARRAAAVDFPRGAAHDAMLDVISALVRRGVQGEPGIGRLLDDTRDRYVGSGGADRPRDWDLALAGSVRRFGLPPAALPLSKTERREIKRRNKPEAIEKAKTRRKAAPVASNDTTSSGRILEDGPLAEDLHPTLARTWAYAKGRGLMRFDGKVWCAAEERVLEDDVRLLLVEIADEELRLAAQRMDKPAVAKATTLFSRTRAVNVAKFVVGMLAKSEPTFDAHPDLLNVQNGVVDLRTGELAPHDPALYFTNIAGAKYKPGAAHPDVSTMLEALDRPVREWLQIRAGNAATGYQPDDTAIMTLEGGGANGKSTVINAVKAALGTYARTAPEKLLLPSRGDHSTELASIAGARLVFVEELPEGRHVNAKRVKDLAGTGTLTARLLYQDNFEFVPVHATWISTNYTLQLSEVDDGTWRRFERVIFPYKYVDEPSAPHERKKDRGLVGRLLAGRAGRSEAVLAWIVEGARLWYENGQEIPAPPEAVAKAKIEWRSQTDLVMAFAAERLTFDADETVTSKGMADAFSSWLFNNGHPAWSHQTITARLEGHELFARNRVRLDRPRIEGKRVRAWVGVGLRPNEAVLDSFIAAAHK